ncbi:hypothetical protein [Bowmanella pacifica]|uniref:Uncharacterized protein n=1 Tax=Bowmanella pacifica TaxID=502051 RepID=A0A918DFA5_9ALTE|nr:hypothetical protein [Bowmanella pacifica]GGO63593.1 hypothetical protein GCM10010982_00990 [Bowmanella pacifica]
MLNKKILAAAIASAFSLNAFAVVDLDAAGTAADPTNTAVFAAEAITATDLTDGLLEATNAANILDLSASVGFTIGNGTSKYVRVTLGNGAEFAAIPTWTLTGAGAATATISQGGNGESFVIFEVAATADVPAADSSYTVAAADYLLNSTGNTAVTVTTYETAADAVNETNALYTDSGVLSTVTSVVTGEIADEGFSTATVASDFVAFSTVAGEGDALSATLGQVGALDTDAYVDGTAYDPDGNLVNAATFLTAAQTVTITGDFSFGAGAAGWTLEDEATCADVGGVPSIDVSAGINADENAATVAIADVNAGPYYLCVEVDGAEEILKGSYSIELNTDEVSDVLGRIVYDTTSIEVPYLTTFNAYNQRIYIVNYGSVDAAYTINFVSEDGVTAVAGAAATGSVPAGEMLAIKATDIVTLSGKTRTSAVIEIEAEDADVSAASQSVNLADGTTDTVVLN